MDLLDKLKKLYALTKSPSEEEARTAAYLLLKTARENGVRVKFEVVRGGARADPEADPPVSRDPQHTTVTNVSYKSSRVTVDNRSPNLDELFRIFHDMAGEAPPPGVFTDFPPPAPGSTEQRWCSGCHNYFTVSAMKSQHPVPCPRCRTTIQPDSKAPPRRRV